MKIKTHEIIDDKSLIGHIILHGIGSYPQILEAISQAGEADVTMTVNGAEIDIASFMRHWQSQVDRMIREEAAAMVECRFNDVREKMDEFSRALSDSLNTGG